MWHGVKDDPRIRDGRGNKQTTKGQPNEQEVHTSELTGAVSQFELLESSRYEYTLSSKDNGRLNGIEWTRGVVSQIDAGIEVVYPRIKWSHTKQIPRLSTTSVELILEQDLTIGMPQTHCDKSVDRRADRWTREERESETAYRQLPAFCRQRPLGTDWQLWGQSVSDSPRTAADHYFPDS